MSNFRTDAIELVGGAWDGKIKPWPAGKCIGYMERGRDGKLQATFYHPTDEVRHGRRVWSCIRKQADRKR